MLNPKQSDKLASIILYTIAGLVILILAALVGYILVQGVPHLSWHFLTSPSSAFTAGGGIGVQLFNSFYLLIITMLISFPIALGAGVYLHEYAIKSRGSTY